MKKRLLKTMPHVPLLELKPELREQDEMSGDPDDPQYAVNDAEGNTMDDVDLNTQGTNEANSGEMEANTTFHNLEEHVGVKHGVMQRVKRFIFREKVNSRNNPAGRIRCMTTEDGTMRYGDDESSESDNEGDHHDGIPLVPRNKRQ